MTQDSVEQGRIRAYWAQAAETARDADGLRPTARDPYLQTVVETAIERRVFPGATLLDVGCGDGYSTVRFARRARSAVGVDFIQRHVETADSMAQQSGVANVTFQQGNVLDLSPVRAAHPPFDIAVSIRCLINLPEWDLQAQALAEIARCVRSGGLLLTSEGWAEGFAELNRLRRAAGLEAMAVAPFNRLISRGQFEEAASRDFIVEDFCSLGFYLYLSRVVQPRLVHPDPPTHLHALNRVAAELLDAGAVDPASFRTCDYSGVYVLRRR